MGVFNSISNWFKRDRKDALELPMYGFFGASAITRKPFARLVFANICDIKADLGNDVEFVNNGSDDAMRYAYFKRFYENNFHKVFHMLWQQGYAVIGTDVERFSLLRPNDTQRTPTPTAI